ncbi:hypothetical protein OHS70_37020 [Streptomyces sp. NBC_00390]|uniref:hypothetical protein n=1 Tax=Streptomyces sp. NBC_00390 TaxID=2975736 RepID=UPI002E1BBCB3
MTSCPPAGRQQQHRDRQPGGDDCGGDVQDERISPCLALLWWGLCLAAAGPAAQQAAGDRQHEPVPDR